MTWRDAVEHFRAWAREGDNVSPQDANRISFFYEELAQHRGNLDDEMPAELAQWIKSRAE